MYAQLGLELKLPDEDILRDDNNILYKHTFMERSCLPHNHDDQKVTTRCHVLSCKDKKDAVDKKGGGYICLQCNLIYDMGNPAYGYCDNDHCRSVHKCLNTIEHAIKLCGSKKSEIKGQHHTIEL